MICLVKIHAPRLELPDGDFLLARERVSDDLGAGAAAGVRATTG